MTHRYMQIIKVVLYTIMSLCILTIPIVTAQTRQSLEEASDAAGISLAYLAQQDSLSRYDLTRLLNAVECTDCINPSPAILAKYTNNFWTQFITIPGEDFRDIWYRKWIYQWQSYYYCVASVADNNYMNGFPILTSPTCPGDFCWSRSVTKGEFFQTIINILKNYIYKDYSADWGRITDRYTWLETDDYARLMLTSKDSDTLSSAIASCQTDTCSLQSTEQFDVLMKYCMFNLDACDMQVFGTLKAWYRPVAEMNVALREWLIADTSISSTIHQPVDPAYAIDILGKVFPRIACTFDLDYDCDGVTNKRDNCPNTYNPNQANHDRDIAGDVCDDDIDGDSIQNPLGIVDARGNINTALWTQNTDNCLFIANAKQSDSDTDRQWDVCDMSALSSLFVRSRVLGTGHDRQLVAEAIYAWDKQDLQWSIAWWWEKKQTSWPFIRQRVWSWWQYSIHVSSTQDPRIYASASVIIDEYRPRATASIQTTISKSYLPALIQSSIALSGPWSDILWKLSWPETQEKQSARDATTNFLIRRPGLYTLTAIVKEWGITTAVAEQQMIVTNTTIQHGQILPYTNILSTEKAIVSRMSVNTGRINDIQINRWDWQTQTSRSLTNTHRYSDPGSYVIRQTIRFTDGQSVQESHTVLIADEIESAEKTDAHEKILWLYADPLRGIQHTAISRLTDMTGYTDNAIIRRFFFDGLQSMTWVSDTTIYTTHGIVYPSLIHTLWQCQTTAMQWTFIIDDTRTLSCLERHRRGSKAVCDMDRDGIDDTCDDDIDGDGVKNAIGVITHNLPWCSITTTNAEPIRYRDHFRGSCQLDNCPFTINTDQKDTNKDFIGDLCSNKLPGIARWDNDKKISDQDGDQIPDDRDQCVTIAEIYNGYKDDDGCPELGSDNICNADNTNNIIAIGECLQCPCQYASIPADLNAWDTIRANIWNKSWSILQWSSSEHIVP